mgnify:CR=1 FL=1
MLNNGDLTSQNKIKNDNDENTNENTKTDSSNNDFNSEEEKINKDDLNNPVKKGKFALFKKIFNIHPLLLFFGLLGLITLIMRMNIFGIKELIKGENTNQSPEQSIVQVKEKKKNILDEVNKSNDNNTDDNNTENSFSKKSENLSENIMIDESIRIANIKINSFIEKITSTNVIYDNKFIAIINNKLYKEGDSFTQYGQIEKINLICKHNELPIYRINIVNKENKNYKFPLDIPLINGKKITFTFDAISIYDKFRNKESIIFEGENLYNNKIVLNTITELDNYQLKFNYECNNKNYILFTKDGEVISK